MAGEETSTAAAGSSCRGAEAVVVAVGSSESRDAVVNVCSPSEDGEVPTAEILRPFNTNNTDKNYTVTKAKYAFGLFRLLTIALPIRYVQ